MSNEYEGIKIICSGGTSFPLVKAAKIFQERTGIVTTPVVGKAHVLYQESKINKIGDLFHIGAQYQGDIAEIESIITKSSRTILGFRRVVIAVPKGNPKNIKTIQDLTQKDLSLSICATGCLSGAWDDVCGRTRSLQFVRDIQKNITSFSDGCLGNCNKLMKKETDASFGWNVFGKAFPDQIETIELPESLQIRRTTNISIFSFSKKKVLAEKFIEFLKTPEVQNIYKEYGWEV
jgi:accessory colonization factor AcfC